jgi:hypothetical protein
MIMTQATMNQKDWLQLNESARLLGIGTPSLLKCAASLGIRVRVIPGRKGSRFFRADVESAIAELERQEAARVAAARQPCKSGKIEKTRQRTI